MKYGVKKVDSKAQPVAYMRKRCDVAEMPRTDEREEKWQLIVNRHEDIKRKLRPRNLRITRARECVGGDARGRSLDIRRDVGDAHQHVHRHVRAAQLFLARPREEAIGNVIAIRGRERSDARDHAVMVGEHKTLPAHVRGRASRNARDAGHDAIEPRLIWRPAQFFAHAIGWEVVERPHAFAGHRGRCRGSGQSKNAGCCECRAQILAHEAPKRFEEAVIKSAIGAADARSAAPQCHCKLSAARSSVFTSGDSSSASRTKSRTAASSAPVMRT